MEFSCLHFFFSLPNAVECGTSLGCSEQQHFHGEATRARMPSASQGSNSRGHLDRPTFGRYWVWQCSSLRDCFALPHHSRISSSRLGLPGWICLWKTQTDTELRLREGFCTLSQENSTHYLGHGRKSQVLDDKLERHFFTQRHLAMQVPPKRDW